MSSDARTKLEDIALELVRQNGPRAFTMAELSRRAGVSVAAPYKHFADKNEVLISLAARGARVQRDRILAAMAAERDPESRIVAYTRALVRFAAEDRGLAEMALLPGLKKDLSPEVVAYSTDIFRALMDAAQPFVPDETARHDLLFRLGAAARGIADFWREGVFPQGRDTITDAEDQGEQITRAILADAARSEGSVADSAPPPSR